MDESQGSVRIEKLNDSNFHSWKRKIQLLLAYRDLEDYIHDDRPLDEESQKKWDRGDRKAQAVIGLSLSDEHLEHVSDVSSAKNMWNTLLNVFERHTLLNNLAARRKFYTVTMDEGEKVLTYVNRVQHLASVLKSMNVDIDDKEMAMAVLNGLPPRFDSLIVALDALGNEDKIFTLEFVKSRLLQEEQRASMREVEDTRRNAALLNNGRGQSGTYKKHVCTNCGHMGHTAGRCWGKDVNGRRPDPPQLGLQFRRNDKNTHPEQQSAFVGRSRDIDDKAVLDESEYACLMSKLLMSKETRRSSSWIVDSACTSHMTFDRSAFVSYHPLNDASVEMGTKAQTRVAGRGNVLVMLSVNGRREKCLLQDVLHVPEFEYSLLSVSALDVKGVETLFNMGRCEMSRNGMVVATGTLRGSLYLLDLAFPTGETGSQKKSNTVHVANVTSLALWHQRLAHVHSAGIVSMVRNKVVDGIKLSESETHNTEEVCAPCVLGKCHRSPIPRTRSVGRAANVLDLVHSDVCGPLQVPSLGGARYFVTFIDDYSGWATTYTMKRKFEVFEKYKHFEKFNENHTERRVKILRTDRGGEYMSDEYEEHLTSRGVLHQLSAVETPQQNGVSERLNRTLLDLVRSMIHAKNLPKQFWAEALATAVYVRNRVTSRSIGKNKTPHHLWHGHAPNLAHLRVFGSKCWYKIPPSKVKKLDERAREAIMIGYADSSKAYKLWDDERKNAVVSRDVTFDEASIPQANNVSQESQSYMEFNDDSGEIVMLDVHDTDVSVESPAQAVQEVPPSQVEDAEPSLVEDDSEGDSENENENEDDTVYGKALFPSSPEPSEPPRRSTREKRAPSEWWKSYVSEEQPPCALLSTDIPSSYMQAVSGKDASFWETGCGRNPKTE